MALLKNNLPKIWHKQYKREALGDQIVDAPYYTRHLFDPIRLQMTVKAAVRRLEQIHKEVQFDSIVGSGHSGIVLCSAISVATGVPFAIVRRENEKCHDMLTVNGYDRSRTRHVFIDDLIATGKTFHWVKDRLKGEIVAILLHDDSGPVNRSRFETRRLPDTSEGKEYRVYYIGDKASFAPHGRKRFSFT